MPTKVRHCPISSSISYVLVNKKQSNWVTRHFQKTSLSTDFPLLQKFLAQMQHHPLIVAQTPPLLATSS